MKGCWKNIGEISVTYAYRNNVTMKSFLNRKYKYPVCNVYIVLKNAPSFRSVKHTAY